MKLKFLLVLAIGCSVFIVQGVGLARTVGDSIGAEKGVAWSIRMANSLIAHHPDAIWYPGIAKSLKWDYERGVALEGIAQVYNSTRDARYQQYIQKQIDQFVSSDGSIRTYDFSSFNLDNIATGRLLLSLYAWTGEARYKIASDTLRKQLAQQPRTKEGGFWHKNIYPYQMWLDGLYMAEPFYAQYAAMASEDSNFDDIVNQFIFMENHARDSLTGLLFHGWDESRQQQWANTKTGCSPSIWARAIGWYGMGLVDVLDWIPENSPKRTYLIGILKRLAKSIVAYRDRSSGVWYQVVDKPGEVGNYPEASASCMFVYTLVKGVRRGYLAPEYLSVARSAFDAITSRFVTVDKEGYLSLHHTCESAGLGGQPYRDGSYKYYVSEPQRTNDFKGIGAFIMAADEIERSRTDAGNRPKVVMLDYFYNCEWKKMGETKVQYHYIWEDTANSGFSVLGRVIEHDGAHLTELHCAPTKQFLDECSAYMIVDPDTPAESGHPNYISESTAKAIADWVADGGVLVLMGNDQGNAEFEHFNHLAGHFGIRFNEDSHHRVVGNNFTMGQFVNLPSHPIFHNVRKVYLKEICSLTVEKPANPLLVEDGKTFMALARVGRGTVFAVGDPWLYNEYIDSRKLPPEFENLHAAKNLFGWLLSQAQLPMN